MAKWKKTSSEKIVEVITAKISNPDLSLRDIELQTGVNYKVSGDILNNEMEEVVTSSNKTRELLDVNISIINEWKRIIEAEIIKLWKWEWNVKINNLNDIKTLSATLEDAFKQNQLLWWWPTEIVDINWSDILKDIQNWKIKKDDAYSLMQKMREWE
jgi:hypothetical protein